MRGRMAKKSKLPSFFKPLFWSYKFSSIDPEKHIKTIIVNSINYGDWKHWQWLARYYGKERLRRIIKEIPMSEFRKSALRLMMLIFNIRKMKYVSRSAKIKAERNI